MLDLKIRNGVMIDGAKMPRYQADLGIQGDHITEIGNLAATEAQVTIEAAGALGAPGVNAQTVVPLRSNNKDLFDSRSQNGLSLE